MACLTHQLQMVNLVDVESTDAAAFAIGELVPLDVVGMPFGNRHGVFVGLVVLALVIDTVTRGILRFRLVFLRLSYLVFL